MRQPPSLPPPLWRPRRHAAPLPDRHAAAILGRPVAGRRPRCLGLPVLLAGLVSAVYPSSAFLRLLHPPAGLRPAPLTLLSGLPPAPRTFGCGAACNFEREENDLPNPPAAVSSTDRPDFSDEKRCVSEESRDETSSWPEEDDQPRSGRDSLSFILLPEDGQTQSRGDTLPSSLPLKNGQSQSRNDSYPSSLPLGNDQSQSRDDFLFSSLPLENGQPLAGGDSFPPRERPEAPNGPTDSEESKTPLDPTPAPKPDVLRGEASPYQSPRWSSDVSRRVEVILNRIREEREASFDAAGKALAGASTRLATAAQEQKREFESLVREAAAVAKTRQMTTFGDLTTKISDQARHLFDQSSGYQTIRELKEKVVCKEQEFRESQKRLEESAIQHERASSQRSQLQRELNSLLQRKHVWSEEDLLRFTTLYRREHGDEQSEKVAAEEHRAAEQAVERAREAYVEAIRERYHEEQSWSDRVRGAATYGTWALMGVNVLLFLLVQTVFEPRKRDKLVARFEATLDRRTLEERAIVGKQLKLAVEDAAAKNGARVDDVLRSFSVEATALLDSLVKEREAMGHTAEEASALAEMDLYDGRRLASGSIMPSALPPSSAPETTYEEPRAVAERCFAGNAHPPKSPDDIAREAVSAERNRIAGLWPPTSGWSHFIRSVCSAASIAAESPRQLTNKELILVGAQSALFGCLVTGLATAIFGR